MCNTSPTPSAAAILSANCKRWPTAKRDGQPKVMTWSDGQPEEINEKDRWLEWTIGRDGRPEETDEQDGQREEPYNRKRQMKEMAMCNQNYIKWMSWIDISDQVISWNVDLNKQWVRRDSLRPICYTNWMVVLFCNEIKASNDTGKFRMILYRSAW